MSIFSSGKIWPYAITASIILVFGFCVATIMITLQRPVEHSDTYMMNYHHVDLSANQLIQEKINFNKKYKISYITDSLSQESSILKYRVTDLDDNPVNNANIVVVITRPNNHKHDQELTSATISNGVYVFNPVQLAEPGRWDIMAKVEVDELRRFYNVKADTRAKEAFEY